MIPTDYKDISVNYVYLKNTMIINLTLMKNNTYWGLLRVSHSATFIFTLVAPPFPPEAYQSMVTGSHIRYLVKLGYHLGWVFSSALPRAHIEGTLQTSTHTKLHNHSLIATVKGTENCHRGWLWPSAPGPFIRGDVVHADAPIGACPFSRTGQRFQSIRGSEML